LLLLNVKDLKKSYGGVIALKGVDFDLKMGECHALVGENGAGKSTLIKCIAGVIKPDSGKIMLENKEVSLNSPKDALEKGIAAVYQEPMIYPQLSVVENLFLGKEIKKSDGTVNWKVERKKAQDLLKKVGIKDSILDVPMGNLSMAFQQLVLIAKSLLFTAKILIFDEPTAILTEQETLRLFDIIKELQNQGLGIIYISHRLEELEKIADRITIMRDGEVKGTFLKNELSRDKIIELMAGKHIIERRKRETIEGETILEVRNFTKKKMFENISFEVRKGEILGFSGLVGAGRSELMQSIFGIYRVDSGVLIFENKRLNIRSPEQAIKTGIAYLPEDRGSEGLFLNFSILDNITISILKHLKKNSGFIDKEKSLKLANDYLRLLEIKAPSIFTEVKNLSGGNQQKVLISKWLATTPKLLILDEPTRGVDVAVKSEIHDLIFNLAEEGLSIILISSELPEILKLSDRVIVMHEGIISGVFEKENINETNLIKASIGENMAMAR